MAQDEAGGVVETVDMAGHDWSIAIHGGAGTLSRVSLDDDLRAQYHAALEAALEAGAEVLRAGGDSVSAVETAVVVLEDSPLFNAGIGSVMDETGNVRTDASIMRGSDRGAGAVAGAHRIKNPIIAARGVMEKTNNAMLAWEGADWFAAEEGYELINPFLMQTERRRNQLLQRKERFPDQRADAGDFDQLYDEGPGTKFGTVGAVARDQNGDIAAATSTGGRANKRFGRIGDSPVIGAGTYADNASCAVSGTGHGEYFIRWTVARDVCARVEFGGMTLPEAADKVVNQDMKAAGGDGAVIAVGADGQVVFAMNTPGMYRGAMSSQTGPLVAVFADETVAAPQR